MAKKVKEFFHQGPDGAGGILFRSGNLPRTSVFRDLFDSIVFSQNSGDSATETNSGHARIETDARAINRSKPNNEWTKFIQAHQLPNLYLEALAAHTAGTAETYGHLQITPLTFEYDSGRTRRDWLIESILTLTSVDSSITVTPTATGWDLSTLGDTYKIMLNAADGSPDYIENKLGTSLQVLANLLEVHSANSNSIDITNTAGGIVASLNINNAEAVPIRNYISATGLYSQLLFDTNTLVVDPVSNELGSVFEYDFINSTSLTITRSDLTATPVYRTWNIELNPSSITAILGFRYSVADESVKIGNIASSAVFGGTYNFFAGYDAGVSNTGHYNLGIGNETLRNNSGSGVIGFGTRAGYNNTANNCIFIGANMGNGNTDNNRIEIGNSGSNALPFIAGDMSTGRREYRMTTGGSSLSSVINVYDFGGIIADGDTKELDLSSLSVQVIKLELTVIDAVTSRMNRGVFIANGSTVEMVSDKFCCNDESSSSVLDDTPMFSTTNLDTYVCVDYDDGIGILTIRNRTSSPLGVVGEIKYYGI